MADIGAIALQHGMPSNLDAERLALGAAFTDQGSYRRIAAVLTADDFSIARHQRIFAAMAETDSRSGRSDMLAVSEYLRKTGALEPDGLSYIAELTSGLSQVIDADSYIRVVKDHSVRRRAIMACDKLAKDCLLLGDCREVLDQAERVLRDLGTDVAEKGEARTAGEVLAQAGGVQHLFAKENRGIPLPWPHLDYMLGGLRSQQLIVLAARPSVGKTAFASQIAAFVSSHGRGVMFYTLEMTSVEMLKRMVSCTAQVGSRRIEEGRASASDRNSVMAASVEIADSPLLLDDTARCTVPAIYASLRRITARRSISLVVVDYLQLMESTGRTQNRTEAVTAISRGLKLMAKEFDFPILALSQLNRASESEKRRPQLSDLRDSGSIEQDADIVLFLHRLDQKFGQITPIECIIAKQRNGPIGKVDMNYTAWCLRFEECEQLQEASGQ